MATRTVAGRTSLLKRLQLAAFALTAVDPPAYCPGCRKAERAIASRIEPSIDQLLDVTNRILAEHGPSLWDQIPRRDLGVVPLASSGRHDRMLMAAFICLAATLIFIAFAR